MNSNAMNDLSSPWFDYGFNQFYERRIELLLESQWEEFARDGFPTSRTYVFAVSYE